MKFLSGTPAITENLSPIQKNVKTMDTHTPTTETTPVYWRIADYLDRLAHISESISTTTYISTLRVGARDTIESMALNSLFANVFTENPEIMKEFCSRLDTKMLVCVSAYSKSNQAYSDSISTLMDYNIANFEYMIYNHNLSETTH